MYLNFPDITVNFCLLQAALSVSTVSTTEGVDVIPEPSSRSLSREELLRRSDSPSVDLATWLGSMPRLRSESFEFPDAGLVGGGERDDRSGTFASPPAASPAPAHSFGKRRCVGQTAALQWRTYVILVFG